MLEYRVEFGCGLLSLQPTLNALAAGGWRLHSITQDAGGDLLVVLEREIASIGSTFIPVTIAEPVADSAVSQTAEQTARSTFIPVVLEDDLFDLDAVPTRKRGRPKKQTT